MQFPFLTMYVRNVLSGCRLNAAKLCSVPSGIVEVTSMEVASVQSAIAGKPARGRCSC